MILLAYPKAFDLLDHLLTSWIIYFLAYPTAKKDRVSERGYLRSERACREAGAECCYQKRERGVRFFLLSHTPQLYYQKRERGVVKTRV